MDFSREGHEQGSAGFMSPTPSSVGGSIIGDTVFANLLCEHEYGPRVAGGDQQMSH